MDLPKMHECGLVLSVIDLQVNSVGLLNNGFNNTVDELSCVKTRGDAVADPEFALRLF
jgi:hypothetical protein